jgi:hypothetical protein
MEMSFTWDKKSIFGRKKALKKAQENLDRECIEKMTEFVPVGLPRYRNSGKLRDSAQVAESGKIVYTAPFARSDYYSNVDHTHGGNPNAVRLWFEAMKHKYGRQLIKDTAEIMGCRVK